ncbi:MAG: tetratricopeptide repeat protein [Gammaproteobacteria bacterium]|nr:MAG: tetratricopeptide repeat protein [Gammaproteobacteria bacterium]
MNDLSDKEQLEEMRAWWSENGRFVITGVVLGIAIIFGWNQWRSSVETSQIEASNLFEEVLTAMDSGDSEAAEDAAGNLFDNYQRTVYPAQARLAMARLYMDKGRDQDAVNVLRELVVAGDETEVQLVGRLRLAKVLLYQNKPDEVVEILRDRGQSGFAARYLEMLGDAYATQGNFAEAQTAYLAALSRNSPVPTIDNNLIQLKLNDLPDLTELAATSAAIDEAEVAGEPDFDAEAMDEPAVPAAQDDAEPDTGTGQ